MVILETNKCHEVNKTEQCNRGRGLTEVITELRHN